MGPARCATAVAVSVDAVVRGVGSSVGVAHEKIQV
jgi:hypothetical protein